MAFVVLNSQQGLPNLAPQSRNQSVLLLEIGSAFEYRQAMTMVSLKRCFLVKTRLLAGEVGEGDSVRH
jgi:hypothetical protein